MIDGEAYYTYNPPVKDASTWPFDLEQFLLLNVAMGGFAGSIAPNFTESVMQIDYVKVYQSDPLSISELQNDLSISISPNPSSGMVYISSDELIDDLILYNTLGQAIIKKNIHQSNVELNVSKIAKGMYFLVAHSGTKRSYDKLLVNRTLKEQ